MDHGARCIAIGILAAVLILASWQVAGTGGIVLAALGVVLTAIALGFAIAAWRAGTR